MIAAVLWCACAALAAASEAPSVTVIQLRLEYGRDHELQLNSSVEYILEFVPPADEEVAEEEDARPALLYVASSGGDAAHPVLVTARQRAGANTWQLPYEAGGVQRLELQRALCPDDTAQHAQHAQRAQHAQHAQHAPCGPAYPHYLPAHLYLRRRGGAPAHG